MIARANIYHGIYNISAHSSEWELISRAAILDKTTVKLTAVAREGGNITGSISGKGYWDSTPDTALHGELGESQPFTACIPSNADGNAAWLAMVKNSNYSLGGPAGEIVPFTYAAQTTGSFAKGKVLVFDTHTVAGTDTSDPVQIDQSVGDLIIGNLHIVEEYGMNITIKIYSSATEAGDIGVEYTERGAFTVQNGQISEQISWTSTVDEDWWRVTMHQLGGTANTTYLVALGVLPA